MHVLNGLRVESSPINLGLMTYIEHCLQERTGKVKRGVNRRRKEKKYGTGVPV